MAHEKNHDYHILQPSIWPLIGALGAFVMLFGAVLFMHDHGPWIFLAGLVMVLYVMFGWWADAQYRRHLIRTIWSCTWLGRLVVYSGYSNFRGSFSWYTNCCNR